MSELQAVLLAIGSGVVVVIYVYGWWKQRQYNRQFGAAFRQNNDDALCQSSVAVSSTVTADDIVMVNQDARSDVLPASEPVEIRPVVTPVLREPCGLLDERSDYIISIHPEEPILAAGLEGFWHRKFDFNKPVQVCGFSASTGGWERIILESQTLYSEFRVALQLLDRSGVISLIKLDDFRDLLNGIAQRINADISLPDVDTTLKSAQLLDAFCAEVDQMVGINLIAVAPRVLKGEKIAELAALQGMKLEADGGFHLFDSLGNSLIKLVNIDDEPFLYHSLSQLNTSGVTLLLDVPRVEHPANCYDNLIKIAHVLARDLQLHIVDDRRVTLKEAGMARIREQIVAVEIKMCEHGLIPGSAQAHRLFS